MNASDHFELIADLFLDATGMLAPGKNEAPEVASDPDERLRLWTVFTAGRMSVVNVPLFHLPTPEGANDGRPTPEDAP